MENKQTKNTIMILDVSIKGIGSNAKHTSYVTQEVNANTNIKELIRSILTSYLNDASHWDFASFEATVSTYIKEDGKDLNDYNDYDNELLNVDKYDADNTPVEVGYTALVKYDDELGDGNQTYTALGYSSARFATENAFSDAMSMFCSDDIVVKLIQPVYYEINAYGCVDYYDLDGNHIDHDNLDSYLK